MRLVACLLVLVAACGESVRLPETTQDSVEVVSSLPPIAATTTTTTATRSLPTTTMAVTPTTLEATTTQAPPSTTITPLPTTTTAPAIAIRLRLDRRVSDAATEGFEQFVETVLQDERSWEQAGFAFSFSDTDYDYTVVLAEPGEVDSLCAPYRTGGTYSCQIGPVVALNAERWRNATSSWPDDLSRYRTMLVNHEVGHLLGQHHPAARCGGPGEPAAVMAQQSKGVGECVANPWPLPWEIDCASQHIEPLAPPYEPSVTLTCGPDG